MKTHNRQKGSGSGFIKFIVFVSLFGLGLGAYHSYKEEKQRRAEAEARSQLNRAVGAAVLGSAINALFGGNGSSVGREIRQPDNGYRRFDQMPSGFEGRPSSVVIGPDGQRYYQYDRANNW